ncbi:general transcription factor IIF subunit 1-like [Spea bombifrons]|uniref:general transcription factor IIF subunit 1-like n=1 Tax=Spea bombifrons TaxID=233779 RepID=UPI0023499D8F|nr:general transcription factor IIF subunit 1-like [Spea bombifrons]
MTSLDTSQSSSGQSVTEYVVRVPRNPSKRYNLMAFNAEDKVDFSTWNQARMERDLSAKKMYQEEELPDSGAGSEFNRKQREESRRKKYGIILKEFKTEDQPWVLRVNGKAGRRYKGVKKGGVTENASYYIFTQCPDGAFEAFPVSNWYNFTPLAKHRTLTAEEAEQEWERHNKILNHLSIMQQRRLKDQGGEDEEEEEGAAKQDKGGKIKNDLKIHDIEDEPDRSSESGEEGERRVKPQKKPAAQSKKQESDNEALEDSDDGDFEGQEVDYMFESRAKAVVRRELPKHQRDLIVERYRSGEGYKKISKALDIPWNTVKAVIIKWRKYGTTETLPRTGRPSKIDEKTRRKLVKEVCKRPTATLKELQEFLASTGCVLHVATISRILHMNGLWGRVAKR